MENIAKTIVMMVGISGSGKGTYLKNRFLLDFPNVSDILNTNNITLNDLIVEPDSIRRELNGYTSFGIDELKVWSIALERLKYTIEKYNFVILDATNLVGKDRRKILSNFSDDKKVAVIFKPNIELSNERIRTDIENKLDRSDVSLEVIQRQYLNFKKFIVNNINWDGNFETAKKMIKKNLYIEFQEIFFSE